MHTMFVFTCTLTRVPLHSAGGCSKAAFRAGFPVSVDSEYMVQGAAGDDFQEHVCLRVPGGGRTQVL